MNNATFLPESASAAMRNAMAMPIDIREWYVRVDEGDAVGPVSTELLARGIAAGKVPEQALVARIGDVDWQPVTRVGEIEAALRRLEAHR